MSRSTHSKRIGLAIALTLPVMVVFSGGVLHAQKGRPITQPPQMRQPIVQPPNMQPLQITWTCSKCSKVIGTGTLPPGTCPFCGVKIINGVNMPPNNNMPKINNPVNNKPPVVNNPVVVNPPVVEPVDVNMPVIVVNPPVVERPPVVNGGGTTPAPASADAGGLSTGALIGAIVSGIVSLLGAGGMAAAGILYCNSGGTPAATSPRRREDV